MMSNNTKEGGGKDEFKLLGRFVAPVATTCNSSILLMPTSHRQHGGVRFSLQH